MTAPWMVRVLVDLTRLWPEGLGGGIKPALFEILRWLAAQRESALEFVYVTSHEMRQEVSALLRPADRLLCVTLPAPLAAQELCDVVYCPFGITDLACPGIPTVTLIVDLVHRDFPETLAESDRVYRERCFTQAIARTDWFQVISNYAAERLEHHYGIPGEKIFRTYLPVHQRLFSTTPDTFRPPARSFFIYPANAWVHRNHETLLTAYALYRHQVGAKAWRLVLTGHDDARMQRLRQIVTSLHLDDQVEFAGFVSEKRLAEIWTTAGALVFPSLHEGFGRPLLEAMAHSVPIVASNSTAIPEIVGQAALLVDARDPAKLAEGMTQITQDIRLRALLAEWGRHRVPEFSPEVEFGRLYRLLVSASRIDPKCRRKGFYDVDGLTDPLAIFALPRGTDPVELSVALRPLPAYRNLQIWCGPEFTGNLDVAAFSTGSGHFRLRPRARVLILQVPNASRLCDTDPRSHGVLLESLKLLLPNGAVIDLLAARPTC